MVDVFEEVEDQIRTERYVAFARRAMPWAIGASVALVVGLGGMWGYQSWQKSQSAKAGQIYIDALNALQASDQDKAFALFGDLTRSPVKVYRYAGLVDQGGMRLNAGKTDEAVKLFDDAAKVTSDPALQDNARLKSALALMDTAPYKDIEARLTPLTEEKRPLHLSAREALAFAKLQAGMRKEARADFQALSLSLGASEGMVQRAQVAVALIDSGSAAAMPQAVKDSLTLTPPPQFSPQSGPPEGQGADQ